MDNNKLNKSVWTDAFFDQMNWHDCKIHAIAFNMHDYEIAFDIDYILEWINSSTNNETFNFLISPSTLVFRNVHDFNIDTSLTDLVIDDIERANPIKPKNAMYIQDEFEYEWIIDTVNGRISFKATGFTQYLRQVPQIFNSQSLTIKERNGICFEKSVYGT